MRLPIETLEFSNDWDQPTLQSMSACTDLGEKRDSPPTTPDCSASEFSSFDEWHRSNSDSTMKDENLNKGSVGSPCRADFAKTNLPNTWFHPGLYTPSGFNMMNILVSYLRKYYISILLLSIASFLQKPFYLGTYLIQWECNIRLTFDQLRVYQRPNPKIELGAVDSNCALILCDTLAQDSPIVYCSEAFEHLTRYRRHEILGRNCRFLQSPHGVYDPLQFQSSGERVVSQRVCSSTKQQTLRHTLGSMKMRNSSSS